jgi:predicted O-methyltransferase YrrM
MTVDMIFSRTVKYLKYMLVSRHKKGHGIHSPFIFDLVSRIFWSKVNQDVINTIERIRKKLISDKKTVVINDLGTGPVKSRIKLRKVSDIARNSPVPLKYGILLSNLANQFGKKVIIEFGTSFGISTMYMAALHPETIVFTMEGCLPIAEIAERNFEIAGLNNVKLLKGPFDDLIPYITETGLTPGLVFIDGNHRKKPCLEYFNKMTGISDNETVIIIDDIHYSEEMEDAWNEIKCSKKVTVTVDIYRMGLVFFREGITHKNYLVRY